MSAPPPSPVRYLVAGLVFARGLLARLAFWTAVAYPGLYLAVHLEYGFASIDVSTMAGLVAINALAVAVGHRHAAAGRPAAGAAESPEEPRPAATADDATGVAPVGGD